MKRFFMLASAFLLATVSVTADGYDLPYLVIKQTKGTTTSLNVENLEITFSDGQLVAKNGSTTQTINLSELASMQFSATGDGLIDLIQTPSEAEWQQVFDLNGRRAMKRADGNLPKGVYVVRKSDGSTQKIFVK